MGRPRKHPLPSTETEHDEMFVEEPEFEMVVEEPQVQSLPVVQESCGGKCQCSQKIELLESRLAELEYKFSKFEFSAPKELRALEARTVKDLLDTDPYTEFEVLSDWGRSEARFHAGSTVRADRFPRLMDFVNGGLKLGLPQNQMEIVAAFKAKAEAKAKESHLAEVERLKAEAEAALAKVRELSKE